MNPTKTVIITGGNSGLGYECAKSLAKQGDWHIVIASRHQQRIDEAVAQLIAATGHGAITSLRLDLGALASIRHFVNDYSRASLPPLHAIVCNAGLTSMQNQTTADGIDLIFGVNHLGHYLLVHLLTKQLVEPGRVIFVSSGTHLPEHKMARRMGVPAPKYTTARNLAYPDQAPVADRIERSTQRYSTSKLCNLLAAYEFARQFDAAGMDIAVFGMNPGAMLSTGFLREIPAWLLNYLFIPIYSFMARWNEDIRQPTQSGQDLAWLVTDEHLADKSGRYFDGRHEAHSSADSHDRAKAADLWNTSSDLCNLDAHETRLPVHVTVTSIAH